MMTVSYTHLDVYKRQDLYSPQGKVYNTSVLTIQLQQAESEKEEEESILSSLEGWSYLSNTVIFHSDQK